MCGKDGPEAATRYNLQNSGYQKSWKCLQTLWPDNFREVVPRSAHKEFAESGDMDFPWGQSSWIEHL